MNSCTKKRIKYASNLSLPSPEMIERKRLNLNSITEKKRSSLAQIPSNIMNVILNQNKINIKQNSLDKKKPEQKIFKSSRSSLALSKVKNIQSESSSLSNYLVPISHKSPRSKRPSNIYDVNNRKSMNEISPPIIIPIPNQRRNSRRLTNLPNRRVSIPLLNLELEKFQNLLEKENSISKKTKRKIKKKKQKKLKEISNKKTTFIEKNFRVLKKKLIICDSMNESETDDEYDYEEIYISPESNFIFVFDLTILIGTLYTIFMISLKLAMSRCFCELCEFPFYFTILNYFFDAIFELDLIIHFFRAYYDYEYKIVKATKKIFINYLSTDFFFDLIEAIPFFIIIKYICKNNYEFQQCPSYETTDFYIFLELCSLFKAFKIFKINSDKKNRALDLLYEYISENYYLEQSINFLIFIFECLLFLHTFICFHIFFGHQKYPNWINFKNIENNSFFDVYITSFYFIITTMTTVGYGDIVCVSYCERIFHIILLAIGSIAYSYIISKIGNQIKDENHIQIKLNKNKTILEEIRVTYPLMPFKLYSQIYKYLLSFSQKEVKFELNFLLNSLPDKIKSEVLFSVYKKYINNFKIFKGIQNSNFIFKVVSSFIPLTSKKEEFLYKENQTIRNMIFVKDGRLALEARIDINDPYESIKNYFEKNFDDFSEEDEFRVLHNDNTNTNHSMYMNNISNLLRSITTRNENEKSYSALKKELDNLIKVNNSNKSYLSFDNKKSNFGDEIGKLDLPEKEIENEDDDNFHYIKILDVRKNEHHGNIYITLGKPASLSLKVKSKIAEIFIITKKEVLNISKSYQNIWKKITTKSYKNVISIKLMTFGILQKYCELNGYIENEEINELFTCYLKKDNILSKCVSSCKNLTIINDNNVNINSKVSNKDNKLSSIKSNEHKKEKNVSFYLSNFSSQTNNSNNKNDQLDNKIKKSSLKKITLDSKKNFTFKELNTISNHRFNTIDYDNNLSSDDIKKHPLSAKKLYNKFALTDIKNNSKIINGNYFRNLTISPIIRNKNFLNIINGMSEISKIKTKNSKIRNCNYLSFNSRKDSNDYTPKFKPKKVVNFKITELSLGKNQNKNNEKENMIISRDNSLKRTNNLHTIKESDYTEKNSRGSIVTLGNFPNKMRKKIRKKIKKSVKKDKIKKLWEIQKKDIKEKSDISDISFNSNFHRTNTTKLYKLLESSMNSTNRSISTDKKTKNSTYKSLQTTSNSFTIKSSYKNLAQLTQGYIIKQKQIQKKINEFVEYLIKNHSSCGSIYLDYDNFNNNDKGNDNIISSINKTSSIINEIKEPNSQQSEINKNFNILNKDSENHSKFYKRDTMPLNKTRNKFKNIDIDKNEIKESEYDIKSSQEFINKIIDNNYRKIAIDDSNNNIENMFKDNSFSKRKNQDDLLFRNNSIKNNKNVDKSNYNSQGQNNNNKMCIIS